MALRTEKLMLSNSDFEVEHRRYKFVPKISLREGTLEIDLEDLNFLKKA